MGDLSSDKCQVQCNTPTFIGSPKVECLDNDGAFHITGDACYRKNIPVTTRAPDTGHTSATQSPSTIVTTTSPKLNKCFVPTNLDLAYDLSGCDTSQGPITSYNCKVKCPSSHSGPVSLVCDLDGGKFTISGCTENKCKLPKQVVKTLLSTCNISFNSNSWIYKVIQDIDYKIYHYKNECYKY